MAAKPPLGWNSWNTFSHDINETLIKEAADAMVESGLKDAGYEYIVIDDCWSCRQRDENGRLVADPEKFPNGMKALADYIHSKGLKAGIYTDAGPYLPGQCGLGSNGHYQADVTEHRPLFKRPAGQETTNREFNQAGSAI
jgi:hypothetical protein